MYHEEAMVSEFVEDEEETFFIYFVKEESQNHYDNQVVVLSHVENDFSDEISEGSLECSHNVFNNFDDHMNVDPVHDPCEDQSFVEETVVLNHFEDHFFL